MHISAERIAQIEARRDEVQASMTRADLPADAFVRLSKEYAEIEPVARAAHEVRRLRQELAALDYMTGGADADADPLMREMAQEEMQILKSQLPAAERALALQLLPRDSADARPAMLEIRAGTGGDVRGRPVPHVSALCRFGRLEDGADVRQPLRSGRV